MSKPPKKPVQIVEPPVSDVRYFNREVSWLAFNLRVLEEAIDHENPLLERLRFLTIFHTNLDEFFMVRVSGLLQQIDAGIDVLSFDGLSARSQLQRIRAQLEPMLSRAQALLDTDVLPALEQHGLEVVHYADLRKSERKQWDAWYQDRVYPILTPLAVGSTHPFPFISNLSLNLAMLVGSPSGEKRLARVKVPLNNLPAFIPLSGRWELDVPERVLPLEELIAANMHTMFPGMEVGTPYVFRVTRDADVEIAEDEADDLLTSLQQELRKRRFGQAVRLEVQAGTPEKIVEALKAGLGLTADQVWEVGGLLGVERLSDLISVDLPELKHPGFVPRITPLLGDDDRFHALRQKDVLLHHPFDSILPLVDFIRAAARDPNVVAIKQTLYRTNTNSPIIEALQEAVENGKQVAAVVELKARFDEENNIVWAQRLEQAGVHVVYGVPRLKTHAKLCIVIRRNEQGELIRYAHIGTGNYNTNTARVYTDLGLLTSDGALTADVGDLFNHLTGFALPDQYRKLLVAPHFMKPGLCQRIHSEAEHARAGRPGRIIAKCNAIADRDIIEALYDASQAGVRIDLLVRGICCLIPGVPGMSENIRVTSVVGRFLEHSRVYWFDNGGEPDCFIGSADLMDRNLERRVETLAPVEDPEIKAWLREVLLERYLNDRGRSRQLMPDGTYVRLKRKDPDEKDVHELFLDELTR
ncbi:MAG: polyphosphate kinase 1 [Alphaproteobacteria bacterium]|nr:polyphosphate kinase 1 [Alphaproteobacteria bacterium]